MAIDPKIQPGSAFDLWSGIHSIRGVQNKIEDDHHPRSWFWDGPGSTGSLSKHHWLSFYGQEAVYLTAFQNSLILNSPSAPQINRLPVSDLAEEYNRYWGWISLWPGFLRIEQSLVDWQQNHTTLKSKTRKSLCECFSLRSFVLNETRFQRFRGRLDIHHIPPQILRPGGCLINNIFCP